ncbi:hypothetical protein B0O80DRAFT_232984 [Mortierella sp. GBAus27b]|nr:hypothetical protein B0O80DRAFT_232984 [Mortierella sp. GBAus27b]
MDNDGLNRLSPSRIMYHRGTVLELVETKDPDRFEKETSTRDTATIESFTLDSTTDTISDLTLGPRKVSPLHALIKDQGSILESMAPKQGTSALIFRNTIANLQKVAQLEISEDKTIQNRLRNAKRLVNTMDLGVEEGDQVSREDQRQEKNLFNEQQNILDAQQKRIDSLVNFQDSLEKLATLAFGVHDRPVPRLFIVLPKETVLSKDQEHLSYDDFQLYFICECYRENADQEGGSFGNIHLATYEGCDFENAQGFFEDYGYHVQAVLYILMNGITAPEIYIRSMSHLKLTEGVDEMRDRLTATTIESMIQRTVAFMERVQSGNEMIDRESALDLLEQTDLQHLVQYLKDGHTLGKLLPCFTAGGDIRWICEEHYLREYRRIVLEHQEEEDSCDIVDVQQPQDDRDQNVTPSRISDETDIRIGTDRYASESDVHATRIHPNVEIVPASETTDVLPRIVLPEGGEDEESFVSMMERLPSVPPSTDISGQTGSYGSSMLHNAVMLKFQKGVDILIEEGVELDIEDDAGLTALDYAIFLNHVEITEALLRAGSMPSYERLERLPLATTPEMSALLKNLCDMDLPVSEKDPAAPQMPSAVEGEREGSHKGKLIQEDTSGEDSELEDTVSGTLGLTYRASENLPPQRSSRPLSMFSTSTRSTGMQSLAPTMSTMGSLASSTGSGTMMSHRRAPNVAPRGGLGNIYQCAKMGNLSLVKHHLEIDSSLINAPWKFDGRCVLGCACASSRPGELVVYLVQRGAQVNQVDTFHRRTALHILCEEGGLFLEDWGTLISQVDRDADDQDVLAAMRCLLDHDAMVDARNHWKETPLMRLFAGRDSLIMVQELYSRGADSRLKSSKDAYPHGTALCYAAFYGRIKSLKWMLENDLLLNDEGNIKEAIRWANKARDPKAQPHAGTINLLESWAGKPGAIKRKDLAKEITAQSSEDWWRRMSGIVVEDLSSSSSSKHVSADAGGEMDVGGPSAATSRSTKRDSDSTKMPAGMMPLWHEVHALSEGLSNSDAVSSPGSRMKWNPLTILRK